MQRRVANRKWTFRALSPEDAMDAMEAEMKRLGHRVITHELVEPRGPGRYRVQSVIAQGEAQ